MRRLLAILLVLFAIVILLFVLVFVPLETARTYGPPASTLSRVQAFQYSVRLFWYDGLLTEPLDVNEGKQTFIIQQGESVFSIASRLEQARIIRDARAFTDYLIYTGFDTSIQSGAYQLGPSMSIVDVAAELQDATPAEVTFVVLPGWRMEEIAASLPTSGLDATPEQFLEAARKPSFLDFVPEAVSSEGLLYPDTYILPRQTNAEGLVEALTRNFSLHLTADLREGFARQGLSVYQAVTLASIVEREAIRDDEAPLIASVYLNRLNIGMKLDADPTVQYALGYNPVQGTWWTNPLSAADLQTPSAYNTYLNPGLPPGPISNPGLNALRAVAIPAQTPYYFFRAKCDGSGYHVFAETFEEHLGNGCR
jgi:UPF0755 protein